MNAPIIVACPTIELVLSAKTRPEYFVMLQVSSSAGTDQEDVKIHICARCARLIDNGEQEEFDASSVVTVSSSRGGGHASSAVTLADDGECERCDELCSEEEHTELKLESHKLLDVKLT